MSSAKKVTIENITGKELEKNDVDGYRHGYILYKNNVLYMVVAYSKSNKPQTLQDINRFLASYHPMENKASDISTKDMYGFSDSAFAYSIKLPAAPQSGNDLIQKADRSMRSDLKVCIDPKSGSYYIFGVNQTAPGYSITNDSTTIENLRRSLKNKCVKVWRDTSYFKNHHRVLEIEGLMAQANLNAKSYYEMRGNRWYAILAMYMPGKSTEMIDKVIHSFQLLDFQTAKWQTENAGDGIFSTWSPSKIFYSDGKDTNYSSKLERYEIYDSTRSNSYVITREGFGKYFWQKNDSALWESLAKGLVAYNDTLLTRKAVHNGAVTGIEIEEKEIGCSQVLRKRVLLYGDSLYSLSTTQPEDDIHGENVNRFFEDFLFKTAAPTSNVFQSKLKELLEDLLSTDSSTFESASKALNNAIVEKKDISMLEDAILKSYKQEEYYYQTINEHLANKLIELHDTSTLVFARENYRLTTNQNAKLALLNIISSFKSADNYKSMAELLIKSPPLLTPAYKFRNNLKDSISMTATSIYPSILALITDSTMAYPLLDVSSRLLDSNVISIDGFRKHESDILAFAARRYAILKADSSKYHYDDIHLLSVIQKFNDKAGNETLNKWFTINDNYLRLECIQFLLSNKQPLNQTALLKLAKDKLYRVNLYRNLVKYNRQALFPKDYLSQRQFAESLVFNSDLEDDDDDVKPDEMILVSQKTIRFKKNTAKFYFFKLVFKQDETQYRLACAGPFSINPSDMSIKDAFSSVYYKEDYDAKQFDKQSAALIKQMEEENRYDEE